MTKEGIQPIFILSDAQRTKGRDAQRMNIEAAKLVAEMVRTTLGPKGMDKMIVDSAGEVTVTNDGATILEAMSITHPTARMMVEIAKTQESEVGDGTTTAVVLAGELLKKAELLLDQEIHPTVITRGYRFAAEKATSVLRELAVQVKRDRALLEKVAMTATTGKGAENAKESLAKLVVESVLAVATKEGVDKEALALQQSVGGAVEETELIRGVVLEKERVHPNMPSKVIDARILLLDVPLEMKTMETDAKITITDPSQLEKFMAMEEELLSRMAEKVIASGANVLCCQKGIDDAAQHALAKAGILALRRVSRSDLERLAKATGARIVSSLDELGEESLGRAGLVEETALGEEHLISVRECHNPRALTILVRGGTEHIVAETARALEDAIGVVAAALEDGLVVAGAGAPEVEVSRVLEQYSASLSGRERLAVRAFAEALEVIPRTLAENAGIDSVDALTTLKAAHERGERWAGINVFTGKKVDAWKAGVLEPLRSKVQAVSSAAEVAMMILRIDDVISAEADRNSSSKRLSSKTF